jgi:2-methylisocitrate lyase-like PEP mutase family enzyme
MVDIDQKTKVQRFRSLHTGPTLVLPNAWDAGSAVLIAAAGASAIATTSGGVAWSLGRPDGQQLGRSEMIDVVRRIAAAVDVPVSADVEGGYGPDPAAVGLTVEAVVSAGAVGVNLEDSGAAGGGLFDLGEQAARLAAARAAAVSSGLAELVINARTDVYLFGIGAESERFDHVLSRAAAYAEAGADFIFVPGLADLAVLERLVAQSALPVSVMAGPGGPTVAELSATGVRRISVGTALSQAAYGLVQTATVELLQKGTFTALADGLDFGSINGLFATGH